MYPALVKDEPMDLENHSLENPRKPPWCIWRSATWSFCGVVSFLTLPQQRTKCAPKTTQLQPIPIGWGFLAQGFQAQWHVGHVRVQLFSGSITFKRNATTVTSITKLYYASTTTSTAYWDATIVAGILQTGMPFSVGVEFSQWLINQRLKRNQHFGGSLLRWSWKTSNSGRGFFKKWWFSSFQGCVVFTYSAKIMPPQHIVRPWKMEVCHFKSGWAVFRGYTLLLGLSNLWFCLICLNFHPDLFGEDPIFEPPCMVLKWIKRNWTTKSSPSLVHPNPSKYHGNLRYPPKATPPPINKALLRDY